MIETYPSIRNNLTSVNFIVRACLTFLLGMHSFFGLAQTSPEDIEDDILRVYDTFFYTEPDSALQALEKAAQAAQGIKRWDLQIQALIQAAWCADYHTRIDTLQFYLGRTEQLVRDHASALDTLDPDQTLKTDVAYTRGTFYYSSGDFSSAVDAFSAIAQPQFLDRLQDSLLVADVYTYLGSAYYRLQLYQKALDHQQVASSWLPHDGESPQYQRPYRLAMAHLYQSQSLYALGRYNQQDSAYAQAKELAQQALSYFLPQVDRPRFRNPALSGINLLAVTFLDQQQYDSALHYFELATQVNDEPSTLLINTYNQLGHTYSLMHRYEEAREVFEQSWQLADQLLPDKHYVRATIFTLMGQSQAQQGQWKPALSSFQQALIQLIPEYNNQDDILDNPSYGNSGATKELLEAYLYKGEALWGLYQDHPDDLRPLNSALEVYHRMEDLLNEMRQVFPSVEYKQFVAAHFFRMYEQAIRVSYELHLREEDPNRNRYLAEAFHFSEKSKSVILLEAVKDTQAKAYSGIPDSLLNKEHSYLRKLSLLKKQLDQTEDLASEEIAQLRQQHLSTQHQYQLFLEQLEQDFPKYYSLKHDSRVATLNEIQSTLPDGEVMLTYFYGDSTLFAFGISPTRVVLSPIHPRSGIREQITRILASSSHFEWDKAQDMGYFQQFARDGHAIYHALVGSLLDSLRAEPDKLVIIPDGQLGYLPFDLLQTDSLPNISSAQYASLPYLIKKYPIRYEYSATLFTRPATPKDTATPITYAGYAPEYATDQPRVGDNLASRGEAQGTFGSLLYNREEVQEVARLFESRTFVGQAATESAFRQYAPRSSILHLSMHAFAHNEEPLYSGLVFSQSDTPDTPDDNFLYAYELYNMQLGADLAVLSACETGTGKFTRGEGIMSLGRAFKYAGCPNLAISLWKVNDQTTRDIVQIFFTQLASGEEKDRALQQAKLAFLLDAKGPLAHPYYWASLTLVGDDYPVVSPHAYWKVITMAALVVLIVVLTIFVLKSNKST